MRWTTSLAFATLATLVTGAAAPAMLDPAIQVPAGNELAFRLDASGVQIYECVATASGATWTFRAPEATLLEGCAEVGAHSAGPVWKSRDGSSVAAVKTASFDAASGAIPWLLLRATAHEGTGRMQDVTWVQRLETRAGVAPATGCDAAHTGAVTRVPYGAKYYFFKTIPGFHIPQT